METHNLRRCDDNRTENRSSVMNHIAQSYEAIHQDSLRLWRKESIWMNLQAANHLLLRGAVFGFLSGLTKIPPFDKWFHIQWQHGSINVCSRRHGATCCQGPHILLWGSNLLPKCVPAKLDFAAEALWSNACNMSRRLFYVRGTNPAV